MDTLSTTWALGIAGAIISALGTWAWKHTHDRIDGKADKAVLGEIERLKNDMGGKASEAEMVRQRDNIAGLFVGQENMRKDMNAGFTSIRESMTRTHVDLLKTISEMGKK